MQIEKTPEPQSVVISILNWNSSLATLNCIASLLAMNADDSIRLDIIVIDNGSSTSEWQLLSQHIDRNAVSLLREEVNLGFAGGHNLAIDIATQTKADFIWVLNNDAVVMPDTLTQLMTLMLADQKCGAVSPVITAMHDDRVIDFCGARHDWKHLESIRPVNLDESLRLEHEFPDDMWVVGTAVLFRMSALNQAGLLDKRLFAYYEDDDIGVRLSQLGWRSRLAPHARLRHACYEGVVSDRPPYYFYLMARNSFRFWLAHTPRAHRRFIRLRLLDKSLLVANRLRRKGLTEKSNACLLGIVDGLMGRSGPPMLKRTTPPIAELIRNLFWLKQYRWLRRLIP